MTYRIIKVENGGRDQEEQDQEPNPYDRTRHLYVLQKRRLFGGWKTIEASKYRADIIRSYYKVHKDKDIYDEVIAISD